MLIEWEDVSCAFDGRTVFEGFSGALGLGERVRVTGPSGCGKTTFLSMILGFVAPASGTIRVDGDIREVAAFVPQEADLGVHGTVKEWVDGVFAYRRNRAAKPLRETVEATFAALRLKANVLDEGVAALSGGEKQRVAVAVALLLPRRALILDEPFSALDEQAARAVARQLVEPVRAILYTSHADILPGFATREVAL